MVVAVVIRRYIMARHLNRERVFRDHQNPFEMYNDDQIYRRFRFRRAHIIELVALIADDIQLTTRKGKCH